MAKVVNQDTEDVARRGSDLDFCNVPGCMEFAQTSAAEEKDLLKYKCPRHEAAARAQGETGRRQELAAIPIVRTWNNRQEIITPGRAPVTPIPYELPDIETIPPAPAEAMKAPAVKDKPHLGEPMAIGDAIRKPSDGTTRPKAVQGIDPVSKTHVFRSLNQAAIKSGCTAGTVLRSIDAGDPTRHGWTFSWAGEKPAAAAKVKTPRAKRAVAAESITKPSDALRATPAGSVDRGMTARLMAAACSMAEGFGELALRGVDIADGDGRIELKLRLEVVQ